MNAPFKISHRTAPAGLILAPIAWAVNQQFTSQLVYVKCEAANATLVCAIGVICSLVAAAGLALSWQARRRVPPDSMIRFVATLGTLCAALFILVIAVGTVSGLLLPGCFR